ncbi:MAG: AraC family transcriptional regulator [Chitinophagaceae bacterium]|nr:MAG: AraC family transcriptional regulator [Chitinophagaceae bacterium]
MELLVKNMVCHRCVLVLQQQLAASGIPYLSVALGSVQLAAPISEQQREALRTSLQELGFDLLDDQRSTLVARIKSAIIEYVRGDEQLRQRKLSALLGERLQRDYAYLSSLFSSVEGITIEQYAILQRVELVKELLSYRERSLTEISYELGYSSVAHLSLQFKKITGMTPSQFKQLSEAGRKPLDEVGS